MARLAIILVNYKRVQDTIECIESLSKSSYRDFEIVVIDNASCDGSVERLKNDCPGITLMSNDNNLGFAAGNNVGIRYALKRGSEFVLLLNNDTIVQPAALEVLVQTMDECPDAGIVGGKIYYFGQPDRIWFAGGLFNFNSGFGYHLGFDEIDIGRYDSASKCDFITGCMLIFRKEVAEKIGLLDESYFAYLEDVDFCCRAKRAGFTALYQPNSIIYHKISRTSAWDSPVYIYFNLRNKILFLRKNSDAWKWIPHFPRLLYFYLRQFIRLTLKYHDNEKSLAAWYGLSDGLKNYSGNYGMGHLQEVIRKK